MSPSTSVRLTLALDYETLKMCIRSCNAQVFMMDDEAHG
jgi:hypothetical protein